MPRISPLGALALVVHAMLETRQPHPEPALRRRSAARRSWRPSSGSGATSPSAGSPWYPDGHRPGPVRGRRHHVELVRDRSARTPFPSMADVLYLAGYPFIALGLLLLIRRRVGDGDRGGLLDAAILTTAAAILSWTFLIQPQTRRHGARLAVARDHPRLPGRRPAPDRRRDGPADDPGRPDTRRSSMLGLSLVAPARRRPDLRHPEPRRDVRQRAARSTALYLIAYLLFGAAVAASVDAPADRAASGRRDLARPGPAGLPGRGHDHRPAAGHDRPRTPTAASASSPPAPRSCRCSSWPAWPAWSACSPVTSPSAAPSRRS